ncbi:MAG: carbohydrate-binding domain-containing protein, partial [Muribaculaceae bacterium]|nr:carbohydrate-binding domain-containing protein [Muribaculaceae bacterium]
MKKTFLSILILAGVMAASAAIYPYLNVGQAGGSETSYPAEGLTLHFENGKLVASNDGTMLGSNDLSNVFYMMFGLGAEENPVVAGDVNGDGDVTSADVTALYNWLLSNDDTALVNGDQDGDGSITSGDVTFVYNILLGIRSRSLGEITDGDQTMWVVTGDVKWAFTTSQLDTMAYNNGTSFTAQGKTFNIADVDEIYVDNTPVADNTVDVAYNGNTATMIVAGNIAKNMTATVNGAHVVAVQDADVTDEITYTLAGNTTNGSFYQDGELKISVRLNGLTIHNPDSAAINIRDGKRIAVELVEGTTNNLTDGYNGPQKGCFAVKGHTEFKGAGILNITGNTKNAFWGKEYVEVKKTVGEINILGAKGDGFNINQYYQQNGGKVTIKNVEDDGIQVSYETDDNDQIIEEEENTGEVTLKDGTLDMTISNNNGGKGVKAASNFIILKGTFKVVQSGNLTAGDGDVDYGTCVKAGGDILIHGGTIDFTNTAQGGKGLNADGAIVIDEANTTTTINIKANGQGGTVEAGSSGGGETPQSYRIYVAKPTSGGGGGPGGGGSNAWTNMYLYNSNGTMVANITANTVTKTSGYSTLTFYYYDFGSANSGTYYFKSDNYSSQGRTYVIQSATFTGPTSGEDIYYQLGGYSTTSTSGSYTRTYQLNNVTATYGGSSDISEDTGTSYNAAGIKADGNITVDAGTITVANSGSMSKSFKSKATMTINGGDITLTPSGAMQVINSDASYSSGIKAVDFVMNGGVLKINSSGVAGKGISTTNITTNGGSITINNTGAAQAAGSSGDYYTAKGFKTDGNLTMLGGTIYIKMTGTGGKGIKVNGNYVQGVSGGEGPTLTVITTGSAAGQSSGGGGFPGQPGGGGVSGSAKAIKVLGTIVINGGQSEVNTSTDGAEG